MAVYTHITEDELKGFLAGYDLGALKSFEGIAQGVSNTNYHVFTDRGRYVLTLFEEHRTARKDLPYFFSYSAHLASRGIACPQAFPNKKGDLISDLQGKPAALIQFLEGADIPRGQTKTKYCASMGGFLARMHNAAEDFPLSRDNDWGQHYFLERYAAVKDQSKEFDPELPALIEAELDYLEANWPADKPKIAVHLDLFPDNIFFDNEKVVAMIDMYFAADALPAFDLAIVANAWCFTEDMYWRRPAFRRLIQRYERRRPLKDWERENFQVFCRAACMRFLLSRLQEWFAHEPNETTMQPHDPAEYVEKLKFHQEYDVINHPQFD